MVFYANIDLSRLLGVPLGHQLLYYGVPCFTIDRAHQEQQNDAKIYGKIYRARYFLSSTLSKIYEKLHKWQSVVCTMLVIFW